MRGRDELIRGVALESAVEYVKTQKTLWEAYEVLDLAEYFAAYIRGGLEGVEGDGDA